MTVKIIIYKGSPTPENLAEIGRMIQDGCHTGIGRPAGVNWEFFDEGFAD
jgi:hypothetical protein